MTERKVRRECETPPHPGCCSRALHERGSTHPIHGQAPRGTSFRGPLPTLRETREDTAAHFPERTQWYQCHRQEIGRIKNREVAVHTDSQGALPGRRLTCHPPHVLPKCGGPAADILAQALWGSPSKGQEVEWMQLFLQVVLSRKAEEPRAIFPGESFLALPLWSWANAPGHQSHRGPSPTLCGEMP